jgi:hypothetical protein
MFLYFSRFEVSLIYLPGGVSVSEIRGLGIIPTCSVPSTFPDLKGALSIYLVQLSSQ